MSSTDLVLAEARVVVRYQDPVSVLAGYDRLVDKYGHDDVSRAWRRALAEADQEEEDVPAIDVAHIERQRSWSAETFGPGARTLGVLDHIRKELAEIEAAPDDIGEWVDVIILAFDGAWRAGHEPAEILRAIVDKQTRNEQRVWPDWRTADPDRAIEHVR